MPIAVTPERSPVRANSQSGLRRILYVDAFDSFSNNVIGLLETTLAVEVTKYHIDDASLAMNLGAVLKSFDAVVVGPGPGHPANPSDVGFIAQLWMLPDEDLLPVFGVCLGFQSLCFAHNATVTKLSQPRHGLVRKISHAGADIFTSIADLRATQYHSLHPNLFGGDTDNVVATWKPTSTCPLLQPLAWDISDELNGPILMSVRHTQKPFWGVQFHPESICTSPGGTKMIQNWGKAAEEWLASRHRALAAPNDRLELPRSLCSEVMPTKVEDGSSQHSHRQISECMKLELQTVPGLARPQFQWTRHALGHATPLALCEALGITGEDVILFDSQDHPRGRYSLLGIITPSDTLKVTYHSWSRILQYGMRPEKQETAGLESIDQVWPLLQGVLTQFDPARHVTAETTFPSDCPFWGGFMGYISYEAGLETIQVGLHASCSDTRIPDVSFAFIHRSIVFDHVARQIYIQSLSSCDVLWMQEVGKIVNDLAADVPAQVQIATLEQWKAEDLEKKLARAKITKPKEKEYRKKVLHCQDYLRSGDSYELCLTDRTTITVPTLDGPLDSWELYKKLRRKNPAPFGAFVRLSSVQIVSSSPEKFLGWNRSGHCQLRPIKGTVKKSPTMTRERAHAILNSSKEQAENLMIVDLIRHDLSGICGAANCTVSKLMQVEEYETVYQLVSVIEGQLPRATEENGPTGIDVLKASLPPGSMTGAPKKRSCEILRDIEQRPRGIYSGILGYLDVGGGGDFSVVIRTATQKPAAHDGEETWCIGAGGAVTVQSTDLDEFLEMDTKVTSALGAFLVENEAWKEPSSSLLE